MDSKALLIGGYPRSGTTLLNRIVNSHPDIWLTYEFRNFLSINVPYQEHISSIRTNWLGRAIVPSKLRSRILRKFVSSVFVHRYVRNLHKLKGKIIEPNSIVEVLAKLSPGHRWLGDKFPGYVFNIDRLARFDEIDLLVIYRDVRDVFRSSLQMAQTEWRGKKGYRGGQFHHNMAKPEFVATRWVEAIRIMQEHDERITQIRYEEIVASPEPILHEISDRLDVHPGKFLLSGIQTKSVGRYLGELDKDQIAIIEHIAGPTLERLGYDV